MARCVVRDSIACRLSRLQQRLLSHDCLLVSVKDTCVPAAIRQAVHPGGLHFLLMEVDCIAFAVRNCMPTLKRPLQLQLNFGSRLCAYLMADATNHCLLAIGDHGMGCTMPDWLPPLYVDSMHVSSSWLSGQAPDEWQPAGPLAPHRQEHARPPERDKGPLLTRCLWMQAGLMNI